MTQSLGVSDVMETRVGSPVQGRVLQLGLDWKILIFAAVMSSSMLFANQIASFTVVIGFLAFLLLVIGQPGHVVRSISSNWLLLIFMAWIFLSALWSHYPSTSLYYGSEAFLTLLIGLQLGRRSRHDEALLGLFLGWSIFTLSSLAFGHSVKWGAHGGSAFSGLAEGKNYAGDTAVLGFIFAVHAIRWGMARGRAGVTAYAMVVAVADLAIIGMAQSSGAILGVGEAIILYLALSIFMVLPLTMRTSLLLMMAVFAAFLFVVRDIWLEPLRGEVLNFFGKDSTMTGRLYLWVRADEIMQSHPWLGVGYNGFWVQGNLDAEGLWRSEGIISRAGFNFHNSLIEMRVHLGWVGVAMAASILTAYGFRLVKNFAITPDIAKMAWLVVLFYEFGRMSFESISIAPFSYATMVLVGALAAGGRSEAEAHELL